MARRLDFWADSVATGLAPYIGNCVIPMLMKRCLQKGFAQIQQALQMNMLSDGTKPDAL